MRLTLKNKEWACQLTTDMYNKLHDLEDIEEELGIELVTLFKSVLNGFYVKDGNGITFVHKTDVKEKLMFFKESLFKDYGKTWALTKEELK